MLLGWASDIRFRFNFDIDHGGVHFPHTAAARALYNRCTSLGQGTGKLTQHSGSYAESIV